MIKKLVVIGFVISAFGTLFAEDPTKADRVKELENAIRKYKTIEKDIAAGNTKSDLSKVYNDIETLVRAKVFNAHAFLIIYEAADKDFEAKKYDDCIKKLKAVKDNYVFNAQKSLQEKIKIEKNNDKKNSLKKLLRDLSVKVADSSKVVGDCLFAKLEKAIADKADDKKIEGLGEKAVEAYADYIWGLGAKAQTVWAAKAYVPLMKSYKIMSKYDKDYYGEEYKRLFSGVLANKKDNDSVWPIMTLAEDVNPDSLPVIFEVYEYIIISEKNFSTGLKKHFKTLTKIPTSYDSKRYPDYTKEQFTSWFMKDQLNIEIGKLCLKLKALPDIKKKDKEYLDKTAKSAIILVPTDSQKSNYAAKANELRQAFNMPVEIAQRKFQKMIDGAMVYIFDPKKRDFMGARRYLNTLLAAAGPNSEARAKIWFWIGSSYYLEQKYQEAAYAFEKSQRTYPNWGSDADRKKGGTSPFGENAVRLMMNAADFHNGKLNKISKAITDSTKKKSSLEANRQYIQSMRKSFLEISDPKNNFYKELLPTVKFRYARDNFLTLQSDKDSKYNQFTIPRELMKTVPSDSSNYLDALYYIFKCSYKAFDKAPENDAKLKNKLFSQASTDSNKLFEVAKRSKNTNLNLYMADAQVTIIQLYLGQENTKYLEENVKLLKAFKAKKEEYRKILGAKAVNQIPGWEIRNFVKLGDDQSLVAAYDIWEKWQGLVIPLKNKNEKSYKAAFDPLIRSTQFLMNKGFKPYLSNQDKNKGDKKFEDIKKNNKEILAWFKKHVTFTPSLVLSLIVNADTPKEKAENCEIFMNEWEKGWKNPSNKYHKDARGKMPTKHKNKGPEFGSTVIMVLQWQFEAYEAIGSAESYQKAAQCYAHFYSKINRRTEWLWKEAKALFNAAKQYKTEKEEAKSLNIFKAAAAKYTVLCKKIENKDKKFSEDWWKAFYKVIDCRMGQQDYAHIIKVYKSIRTKISPDDEKGRKLFKTRLEDLMEAISKNAPANAKAWNSHVNDIINRLAQDKVEHEQRKKEMAKQEAEIKKREAKENTKKSETKSKAKKAKSTEN